MTPIKFEESDRILGAGENPNIGTLPIVTAIDPSLPEGWGVIVSCWEPSAEELVEFLKTKRIYIGVMCSLKAPTQPPVYAIGMNPFIELGWKAVQYRHGAQRMFEGKIDIFDMAFTREDRKFTMTISMGENSFLLEEVVELTEHEPSDTVMDNYIENVQPFDTASKEYFWAWELLAAKYKEI